MLYLGSEENSKTRDGAALGSLEVPQNRLASLPDEGVPQAEHTALEVHVLPLQAQKLAFPRRRPSTDLWSSWSLCRGVRFPFPILYGKRPTSATPNYHLLRALEAPTERS